MNLWYLASLITLIIVISHCIKKQKRQGKAAEMAFWDREALANSTRRKSLDDLQYIQIPLESFPTHLLRDNPKVTEYMDIMEALSSQKIVNLTGLSNTDLKLKYGAPNITELSEYDQNYIVLVRTLQQWADELLAAGYSQEAVALMEFAISTNTDVSQTYYKLADYWNSQGETSRIDGLITTAENLNSVNKNTIVRHLREKYNQ